MLLYNLVFFLFNPMAGFIFLPIALFLYFNPKILYDFMKKRTFAFTLIFAFTAFFIFMLTYVSLMVSILDFSSTNVKVFNMFNSTEFGFLILPLSFALLVYLSTKVQRQYKLKPSLLVAVFTSMIFAPYSYILTTFVLEVLGSSR